MLVTAVLGVLASLALPGLTRVKARANESAARAALKTIASAQLSYRVTHQTYAELGDLGNDTPPYIDDNLASGVKNNYDFTSSGDANSFVAAAVPSSNTTPIRSFCITEDGVLRTSPAITSDIGHDDCQGYVSAE